MTYLLSNTNKERKTHEPSLTNFVDELLHNDNAKPLTLNFNTGITLPAVNIKDSNDNYSIEMAIPGLKKSDLTINLEGFTLSISSDLKSSESDAHFTRREFGYAAFKRTFTLPKTVLTDNISAKYNAGILQVVLPKREEAKKKPARRISIT